MSSSRSPETPSSVVESTQDAQSLDQGISPDPVQIHQACNHFQILVIGRANAGKTTLLKKFCQSDEEPEVHNEDGEQVSHGCGIHNINHEIIYQSNPSFVFHESIGFESRSSAQLKTMLDFLQNQEQNHLMYNRVHAIWFCVPAGQARVLGDAELEFFKHPTNGIPVVVIFTKWDVEIQNARNALRNQGKTRQQAKEEAFHYVRDLMPYLDMDQLYTDCSQFSTVTAQVLDDGALKMLFVSKQLACDRLAAEWAMRYDR
ncbi:hypothetical protein NEOLEDRAFT_1064186 [Neolentinus lepideus HHB14362 ss-1]|uniref:Uncharacterized protein n=1 Tax=Neolentinus lepideus HHB14362 ss-1 TaxID=1314782 RepID=A0A165SXG7_9AGAM|nr:hypothetical protein NEOLEDRAFT_1064186 [Neolentinus lepideus HHB14362 ss-1]